jgi:PelA/Pel-15E family pectate lyase
MGRGFALAALILSTAPQASLRDEAAQALKKAATFHRTQVARHGGYVYYTSLDLKDRWGEGKALPDQIFVQPPGTPTVGLAYLRAWQATGDAFFLDAAKETAEALVFGQLESGGWTQTINFGAGDKRPAKYRGRPGGSWNTSSLDDGQTQTALRFLMLADQALGFKHEKIHEAALYGLNALLKAQFPNGAFPQVWTGPVEAKPVLKAGYPDYDWRTENRIKNYWDLYTLNDGLAGTVSDTLLEAHRVYGEARVKASIEKLGEFLILAQMPDPQPGWCQQYTYEMKPAWARKFEPPALTAWEGQDVMRTLIRIHRFTGDKKYLEPVSKALPYYRRLVLPDGRVARYYELKTDKPLYMDDQYRLTYDDSAAPSHYGWKQAARFDAIEKELQESSKPAPRPAAPSEAEVRKVLAALDNQGRWVSTYAGEPLVGQPRFAQGFLYLNSAVFSRNVEILSDFLAATK